ncbi:MAG TPA: thiopeptide-type bacteriocin biosynthesis protein [Longimicrobium sp.]|nr:thiopeptide-type bacteriocin biosynthesis protein [Longimicrobium sp.]
MSGAAADGKEWLSAYLFFTGWIYAPECDRIVVDVVEPFVRRCQREGWIDQHFFIRYSEHGPHVRLRLHGDAKTLQETVWPALLEDVREHSGEVETTVPVDAKPPFYRPGEPLRVTHVAQVPYEPEIDRYGGPHAIFVAERVFQVSSEAAYALTQKMGRERSSRLGKGLLTMVVLNHLFNQTRERGANFAQVYGVSYLRTVERDEDQRGERLEAFGAGFDKQAETLGEYVQDVWERMDQGEELSETLDRYHDGLRACHDELRTLCEEGRVILGGQPVEDWDRVVMSIVPSYTHMMNNRLGVTLQEESYLSYLITRALGRPAEVVAAMAQGPLTPPAS